MSDTTSTFIMYRTNWSSGPGSWEWRDLGHPFKVGNVLPASLYEELRDEFERSAHGSEHYRGCEMHVAHPTVEVVRAELASQVELFTMVEARVRRLEDQLHLMLARTAPEEKP